MTITANNFKSTTIRGNLINSDSSDGNIQANAIFDRNVIIKGTLTVGTSNINSTNFIDQLNMVYYDQFDINSKFSDAFYGN